MKVLLLVAGGGALGAAGRYLTGIAATRVFGHGFPWGTLIVNIAGSLLMGVLISMLAARWNGSHELRAFLAVGILGGFTTFSAFSLDVVTLFERKAYASAALYLTGSIGLSIGALFLGLMLARHIMQ